MADLVIFGTGLIAKLAHFYFTKDSKHRVAAFTVDHDYRQSDLFLGLPVIDFERIVSEYSPSQYKMFIAISYRNMNKLRAGKYFQAKEKGYELVSYISSRCTFLTEEPHGDNCFILEDNTVQPFVKIGNDVVLWSGNHVGHDAEIGDHCFISSHVVISGCVRVGEYSFLGVNSTLKNDISIAPHTLIGAGALIMKNTMEKAVYIAAKTARFSKDSERINF